MKLLVTGATGFLGRAFCSTAAAAGHEVLGLCRSADAGLPAMCRVLEGRLDEMPWPEITRFRPDAAVHLAWLATPGVYLQSPLNETMAAWSSDFFRGLVRAGVGYIAGTGTCIEYAPTSEPLNEETSPLAPAFPYSRAKMETCIHLRGIAANAGVPWSWFRVFYPYGEGEHRDRMPTALMNRLSAGGKVTLKTPDSVKDYIHVADAAGAMLAAVERGLTGPVNIGTGTGVRIMDLARTIAQCCGHDPDDIQRADPVAEDPFPVCIAGVSALRSISWSPAVRLEDGLNRLRNSL